MCKSVVIRQTRLHRSIKALIVLPQVHFLDHARRERFIPSQLCLFQLKSQFKESTQLIAAFSKEYLRGEGDVLRHLSMLKYKVSYFKILDAFLLFVPSVTVYSLPISLF